MPDKKGRFTEQEQRFTAALARTGDAQYAVREAGYRSRASIAKAADPRIMAAVEAQRLEDLNELMPVTTLRLREYLQPGFNLKAQEFAIKQVRGEWKEANGVSDGADGRSEAEMSVAELVAKREALELTLMALAVDVTPDHVDVPAGGVFD